MFSLTNGRKVAGSGATMSLVEFCKKGHLEGVKAALQSGADVNTKGEFGQTGLMWAVIYNHNSVVALLLNIPNIDVTQKDNEGRCALHWAVTWKNIEALNLLINVPTIDVNIVTNNGKNAVHRAVYSNNIEGLKVLLNVPNIDVNIVDNYGYSAVHTAEKVNNTGLLKLLLSHPSLTALTLNMKDKFGGNTPVMLAVKMKNRSKHMEVLVADPRVDLDTTDKEGRSLEEVARWLLMLHSQNHHTWTECFFESNY